MRDRLVLAPEVAAALAEGRPVVALETTAIAHGLPFPRNLETARALDAAVRAGGAVPALIGILDGVFRIGCDEAGLDRFVRGRDMPKVSRRDIAAVLARGGDGATTVAGTMIGAAAAGIAVFATGGLGGVHREAAESFDISADLGELARTPVAVVCSGAKSILDLPKTLELLETLGVPVIGFGTDDFPAFQARSSGLPVDRRVDSAEDAARIVATQTALGFGGLIVANPVPESAAVARDEMERWVARAVDEAGAAGIRGKAITPWLLARVAELSDGRSLAANVALLEDNARVAGRIAAALAASTSD